MFERYECLEHYKDRTYNESPRDQTLYIRDGERLSKQYPRFFPKFITYTGHTGSAHNDLSFYETTHELLHKMIIESPFLRVQHAVLNSEYLGWGTISKWSQIKKLCQGGNDPASGTGSGPLLAVIRMPGAID